MSRSPIATLLLVLAVTALSACTTVVSEQPLGTQADPDGAKALIGEWKAEKGRARFSDAGDGRLTVQVLPKKEGLSAPPPFTVELRHSGDIRYANLRDPDDADALGYLFIRYKTNENGHIVGWIPDTKVFRQAIADGKLAGEILGNRISRTILITSGQADIDAFLAGIADEDAWETNHPVVVWNPDAPDTPK
ncbi:MAG: hypothetical protein H6926_03490 [Chromatiales bacterium]|nr:hypothetical protein [Gammaproteobacteria bacterium]MCP5352238.1 hypothetical protein [Chromatiales bacterium]